MNVITVSFCPHCKSQVRKNEDKQYIGYTENCSCSTGLKEENVYSFSLFAKNLKKVFGFILEKNNSIVTFAQAVDKFGRFSTRRSQKKSPE